MYDRIVLDVDMNDLNSILDPICNIANISKEAAMKRGCDFRKNRCQKGGSTQASNKTTITVPLKNYEPKNVSINVDEKGLMVISATNEHQKETNRNGLRKVTTILEETLQLPEYLLEESTQTATTTTPADQSENMSDEIVMVEKIVEGETHEEEKLDDANDANDSKKSTSKSQNLLSQVKTEFKNGALIVTLPEKPKSDEEVYAEKVRKGEPVDIKINFV